MKRTTHGAPVRPSPAPANRDAGAAPDVRATAATQRSRRWLGFAQAVWVVSAVLALGILLASVPGYLLMARQGDVAGRAVSAPASLVRMFDLAGALASFASALVCLALAGLLFWRRRDEPMALFVSFYLLGYGIVLAGPLEQLALLVSGADLLATDLLQPVLFVVPTLALLALFPNGRFVPRWMRWPLLLAALLSLLWLPPARDAPALWWADSTNRLTQAYGVFAVLALCTGLYAQVYRYRHVSSPTERQQAKWVASGVVCWVLLAGAANVTFSWSSAPLSAFVPWWISASHFLWWLSLGIVPLALTIAVLRFRLFDIDVLIRRTLVYGTLSAILAAVYVAVVLGAQSAVHAATGQPGQQTVFIVASTLLVAALFMPLRRRLQAVIDRRFYRRKYDAERTLAAFGHTLRGEVALEQLGERLLTAVEETMQPAHASLWLRPLAERSVER